LWSKHGRAADVTEWTVMVYMADDNNPGAARVADVLEMKKVGSSADPSPAGSLRSSASSGPRTPAATSSHKSVG
jgi:hypothetical protein